jgi:hypothetical protein
LDLTFAISDLTCSKTEKPFSVLPLTLSKAEKPWQAANFRLHFSATFASLRFHGAVGARNGPPRREERRAAKPQPNRRVGPRNGAWGTPSAVCQGCEISRLAAAPFPPVHWRSRKKRCGPVAVGFV